MRTEAAETSLRAPALVGSSTVGAALPRETSSSFPKVPQQKQQFASFWGIWRILPQLPVPPAIPLGERKGKAAGRTLAKPNPAALAVQEHFNLCAFSRGMNRDQQVPH